LNTARWAGKSRNRLLTTRRHVMNENPTDAYEQYELGVGYFRGEGVPQDVKKALFWLTKSAEQDQVEAQLFLGDINSQMIKNYKKAAYWYSKAAKQGNANGQCNLGVCYENGDGVPQDIDKAIHWYTKAAKQGNEDAQNALDDLL